MQIRSVSYKDIWYVSLEYLIRLLFNCNLKMVFKAVTIYQIKVTIHHISVPCLLSMIKPRWKPALMCEKNTTQQKTWVLPLNLRAAFKICVYYIIKCHICYSKSFDTCAWHQSILTKFSFVSFPRFRWLIFVSFSLQLFQQ